MRKIIYQNYSSQNYTLYGTKFDHVTIIWVGKAIYERKHSADKYTFC